LAFSNDPATQETFGMAVLSSDALASAVPDGIGRSWQHLGTAPAAPASLTQLRCSGAKGCVGIVSTATGPNVALYRNASAPPAPTASGVMLDEGRRSARP